MRAVLFDFDGVLVDSEPLHYRALRACLQAEGIIINEDEYLHTYLAYDDRTAIRIALERHGVAWDGARMDRIARVKAEAFEEAIADVRFFPGARDLVLALAHQVPLAVASGALHAEIESILTAGKLRAAFSAIVGADDVSRSKPDPLPYLSAMAQLRPLAPGLEPDECIAVEDSMPGIASARAAGMTVVAVSNSYPASRLSAAHHVVSSLTELTPASLSALCPPRPRDAAVG